MTKKLTIASGDRLTEIRQAEAGADTPASTERRAFLDKAGKIGVAAPAAALLLAATAVPRKGHAAPTSGAAYVQGY